MVKLPVLFGPTGHELPSLICSTLKRTSPPAVLPRNLAWIHRHRKKGMLFVYSCRACLTQLYQFVPQKWRDGIFPSCLLHCSFSDAFSRSMFKAVTPLWDRPYEDQLQVTHVHSALHKNFDVHSVYNTPDVWKWAILYSYKFIFFDCPNSLSFNILLLMSFNN